MTRWFAKGAILALVLAGCTVGQGGFGRGGSDARSAFASPRAEVLSGRVIVAGPRGFCVDPGATRDEAASAFVMLGSCAVISGNPRDAKPRRPAILTASITAAGAPLDADGLDRLAAFLATDAGRASLARADDRAGEVKLVDLTRDEGMVLVHAEDGSSVGNTSGDYWRGVFETAGELVTVSVSGYRNDPLDYRAGDRLARAFIQAIRRANPESAAAQTETGDKIGNGLASIFNRLQ